MFRFNYYKNKLEDIKKIKKILNHPNIQKYIKKYN